MVLHSGNSSYATIIPLSLGGASDNVEEFYYYLDTEMTRIDPSVDRTFQIGCVVCD